MTYREIIRKAVEKLCLELNLYMPQNFLELTYEAGLEQEASFKSRIEMGIYLEFVKAGIINDSNYKDV